MIDVAIVIVAIRIQNTYNTSNLGSCLGFSVERPRDSGSVSFRPQNDAKLHS